MSTSLQDSLAARQKQGRSATRLRWTATLLIACLAAGSAIAQDAGDRATLLAARKKGDELRQQGRNADAAVEYEKVLALAPAVYGEQSTETAGILDTLADLYMSTGQHSRIEPICLRSLQIKESKLGKDHPDVATCLNNLGWLYTTTGQYAKAEPVYLRSLEIRESKLGKTDPAVATTLNNLAGLYGVMGQQAKAEPLYLRSLEILESRPGTDDVHVAALLATLGSLYQSRGEYSKAEPLCRRSLEIAESRAGKDDPSVAMSLDSLADLYESMGQYARAEPLLVRSLEIRESKLGKNHPQVATSLNNLALLRVFLGQYAKAEPLLRRNLEIYESAPEKNDLGVAVSLNNLALLYTYMGEYAKAEPLHLRSLEIWESKLGKDHPSVALSLNNLAGVYKDMGQHAKAEPLYLRSLAIYESKLGKDHLDVARTLLNLGALYRSLGQYDKAEPLFARSLEIRESRLGPDHPDLAQSLYSLGWLHMAKNDWRAACAAVGRARKITRKHVAGVLSGLSDKEQDEYVAGQAFVFEMALSIGTVVRDEPAVVSDTAEWLLNGKAIAGEAMTQRLRLSRESDDPVVGQIVKELLSARATLASLTMNPPRDGDWDARRKRIEQLTTEEQSLSKKLGQQTGSSQREDPWVSLGEVRGAIPTGAVYVDVAQFRVVDFKAKAGENRWQGSRYVAWVIPPEGPGQTTLVDLGEAGAIDSAVEEFRRAMDASPARLGTVTPAAAEAEIRAKIGAVADLVYKPLEKALRGAHELIVSPDGALWLIPWELLQDKDRRYLIEGRQISYVVSGRDLVQGGCKIKPRGGVIFADPDYDLGASEASAETRRILEGQQLASAKRGISLRSGDLGSTRWPRLAGTAAEARAIAPKIKEYVRTDPAVYTGKDALEGVFKACRSPKALVMSTHGFFLEDQDYANSPLVARGVSRGIFLSENLRPRTADAAPKPVENPMLRCGLVLAGANNLQGADAGDDGVLTGLEIIGTDLRGTDLVVLSACQTGVGRVQKGEGVAGLRQAFLLSGARTVVSTLWRIPDRETAELMTAFFDNLARGQRKAEALRNAQLSVIARQRKENGAAHPFFWAAFTLTGDPGMGLPSASAAGP